MKHLTKITLLASVLVLLAGLAGVVPGFRPLAELLASAQAAGDDILTFDVACDCRTGSPGFFAGVRGDVFLVNGRYFLPGPSSGTATDDPTGAVNGRIDPETGCAAAVTTRFRLPSPRRVGTLRPQHPVLRPERWPGINSRGYATPTGELSLTGGIGGFSGASGFVEEGRSVQMSPGVELPRQFRIQPGSVRGAEQLRHKHHPVEGNKCENSLHASRALRGGRVRSGR
jgi:hypothetical protein